MLQAAFKPHRNTRSLKEKQFTWAQHMLCHESSGTN